MQPTNTIESIFKELYDNKRQCLYLYFPKKKHRKMKRLNNKKKGSV